MTEAQQISMYGETVEQMRSAAIFTNLNDPKSLIMYAMSILSDAQTVLEYEEGTEAIETNRRYINKAKYFMSEAQKMMANQKQRTVARGIVCNICDTPLQGSSFRGEVLYSRQCPNRCDA